MLISVGAEEVGVNACSLANPRRASRYEKGKKEGGCHSKRPFRPIDVFAKKFSHKGSAQSLPKKGSSS